MSSEQRSEDEILESHNGSYHGGRRDPADSNRRENFLAKILMVFGLSGDGRPARVRGCRLNASNCWPAGFGGNPHRVFRITCCHFVAPYGEDRSD